MDRHYYISDDLDVLEDLQNDLVNRGIDPVRIHVLTEQDGEASAHHLNEVDSLTKKDIIGGGLRGAAVGLCLAAIILLLAFFTGLLATVWTVPILFLAVVVLGFCTWEGGLIGVHAPNPDVRKFKEQLKNGQHVLFVDLEENERNPVESAVAARNKVQSAGTGKPEPGFSWQFRQRLRNLIRSLP